MVILEISVLSAETIANQKKQSLSNNIENYATFVYSNFILSSTPKNRSFSKVQFLLFA